MKTRHRILTMGFVLTQAVACSKYPDAPSTTESVQDVQSMQQRSDGKFDVICRDGSHEVATTEDILANRVCKGTPVPVGDLIYGRSDTCAAEAIVGEVHADTDCNQFSATDAAWSIRVNGQCQNISDTTVRAACWEIKSAAAPDRVFVYGRTDTCSADAIVAEVRKETDCGLLSDADVAWSTRINGQCRNIADTTVRKACWAAQTEIFPGGTLIYGRSDTCSADAIVAKVDANTDCSALSATDVAWSLSTNGQCSNIADTTVQVACYLTKTNSSFVYGRSDSCAPETIIQEVLPWTDCSKVSDAVVAWSISINGRCSNIADTNARAACWQIRTGL